MKLVLNTDTFLQNNLTDEEVFYLLILSNDCDIERAKKNLIDKGFITQDGNLFGDFRITREGVNAMNNAIVDSDDDIPKKNEQKLIDLAGDLRALFPKGYQQPYLQKYPWRCSMGEVVERLQKFFFKFGTQYTYDQIREATKRYVEKMKGDAYMKTLRYFLWQRKDDGTYGSTLADEIDAMLEGGNEGHSSDWQNTMV